MPSIPSIAWAIALAAILLPSTPAAARNLQLQARKVTAPQVVLDDLRLDASVSGDAGELTLAAARLHSARLALDGALEWRCSLQRDGDALACAGPLRLTGTGEGELALRWRADAMRLMLARGAARIEVDLPLGGAPPTTQLVAVPARWLAPALAANWQGGRLQGGLVDARLELTAAGGLHADGALHALDLVTDDGGLALRGVDVAGALDHADTADGPRLAAQLQLARGMLGVGVVQAQLPTEPVGIALEGSRQADGHWDFTRLAFHDAAALEFEASARYAPQALAPLQRLEVSTVRAVFPLATQRYLHGALAAQGLAELALAGELQGSLASDAQGLTRLAASTSRLDLRLPSRQLVVDGLRGGIDWRRSGTGEPQPLAWTHARQGELVVDALRSRWQVRDGAWHLRGPLQAHLFGGSLAAHDLVLRAPGGAAPWLEGRVTLRGIGYDAPDGRLGAAGVNLDATLQLAGGPAAPRLRAQAELHGGQYLAGSAYVELPATPVALRIDASVAQDHWDIATFEWRDPGVLDFSASAQWTAPQPALPTFAVELRHVDLARAVPRYGGAWLAARGYPHLQAVGSLRGGVTREDGRMRAFHLTAEAVRIDDGDGRFRIDGLAGALAWDARAAPAPTTLGWQGIEVYKVPFGPARAQLRADRDSLQLVEPLAIDVFGGKLNLRQFVAQPASPLGDRYEASFTIIQAQLPQMSAAFGWPVFPGNLSGGIPEIEFVGDRIDFHGGLDLYLFDGHLGVNTMSLERPFGSAPALGANIHFEDFDLEQLTSAFSFGSMSGRLYGTINDLRLLDWRTVAFDAWLRTKGGGRMSYKAVDDITGIASGAPLLQNVALKLVNTFGFAQLGLRCRLQDQVCTMGGIEPLPATPVAADSLAARGYAIVRGAGLPRIDIIGHRRQVDWPTLVRRLREATRGQAPVIQ